MKKIIYLIVIASLSLPFGLCSQQVHENVSENQISIGIKDSLFSEALKEQREIWIHVPNSHSDERKYPVLYVLDGEYNFESVVGLKKANVISGIIPEMIVVAIPNTDRYRDLTTSHIGDDTNPSGGADNFIKFIETELIPFIDKKYPTTPYRTFFGHSLGGLVVVNTLLNHSHLFNNYLAIDPSLSWGMQKPLEQARQTIKESEFENKSIYIAIANTLNGLMNFEKALEDTTTATLHLRAILEFSKLAESNDQLSSKWKYYENESHGTVPVVAEHDAFRFLFSWYKFEHWDEFYAPEPKLTGGELVELLVSYYERISGIMGAHFYPEEYEVNRLAYMFLGKNDYERALPFFELNIKNYPKSANAYDSMGDYYNSVSDRTNAIKYFSKSLELGGVNGTKEKVEELKKENNLEKR